MTLRDFFPDKIEEFSESEKIISSRFPAFRAKPIGEDRAARIRKAATVTKTVKGVPVSEVDSEANMLGLVVACTTYPDLNDAELQSAWNTVGAESLLQKMLLPGEYALLSSWIAQLCGFDQDINEMVECAKN